MRCLSGAPWGVTGEDFLVEVALVVVSVAAMAVAALVVVSVAAMAAAMAAGVSPAV